ncbi:YlbG family protein [Lactobacillus salivarius]|uniref:YlbG family protein n=1 Tax=Ligilactobacillus salivarius TaxID=1624 RepID=UPI0009DA7698|nr:YlbG family protein [Ligilactobacillus salivarius]NGG71151.1 YlbG family protein [Ligilactobacillus salivarius]OQR15119.1 hypothetical protein B6U42_03100 [Ligilactobacillus salivarius]
MEFKRVERQGVIVYLKHLKQSKQLRKFGTIHCVSRKMKYVLIYMNAEDVNEALHKLKSMKFVSKVEISPRKEIDKDLEQVRGTARENLEDFD